MSGTTPWRSRPGATGDLDFLQEAEYDYIREREPDQESAWLRAVDRNRALWTANLSRTTVLEIDGETVGYAMWAVMDGVATVVTLHVRPAHRRRGLGQVLLDLLTDDVARSGHAVLALGVHRANPARGLYESAGFTAAGTDGDYLLLRRELAAAGGAVS
jgi:ribosomal protein S18 acetylase RimI-like enzyme